MAQPFRLVAFYQFILNLTFVHARQTFDEADVNQGESTPADNVPEGGDDVTVDAQ